MTIRIKLTLLFSGLFAALLLIFSLAIYWSNARQREDEYYKRLKQLAITKTNLLLDAGVAPSTLQLIYKNSLTSLPQEEVAIFDTAFHLLYHDAGYIDKVTETKGMIDSILALNEIHFLFEDLQVNGFVYVHKGTSYVITSAARDEDGLGRLRSLKIQLTISFACAMLLITLAGIYFSRKALQPVSVMIDEVSEISAMSMDLRLAEGNGKDEIAELAMTFNRMLVRLEQSFNAQKQVVSNISHELRTPLAAIIAEAEISAFRDRSVDEYREALRQVLQDARRLSKLSDGLLDLAKASYEPSGITFNELRLDEILLDARQRVLQSHDKYKIELVFVKNVEECDLIVVKGNEYLLGVAFSNLIDNACKFSPDHSCHISIDAGPEKTMIGFADNGIGIPEDEQTKIFTPFYRGSNKRLATGNGIGLSLTQKIILLHNGILKVESEVGKGSVFSVIFSQ